MGDVQGYHQDNVVSLCDGILGTIGALVVDDAFGYECAILPTDMIIVDLTRVELDNNKLGPEEHM